jgi:hypothetical protein
VVVFLKQFLSEDDAAKLEKKHTRQALHRIQNLRHLQWLLPYHHGNSLHFVTPPESLEEYTAYSEAWIPVMAVTTRLSDLDDIFNTKRLNVNEESSMAHNMHSLFGWQHP